MKIGIIGVGNMGRGLGQSWARAAHEIPFGSRDADKGRAAAAESGSATAKAGSFDDAAAFGEVVLYTVRDVLPSALLQTPGVLAGKVVIDCTNNAILGLERPDPEGRPGIRFETADPPRTTRLATDAPQARIVKAFNSIPAAVFALHPETLRRSRASVMVCADDPEAKRMTEALAADLGFQMIDCGGLENDRMVEGAVDVLRYQVVATGWGAFVTLAINPVEHV
jgi:8-hydroxy-5-deazaflavin:NADPH oxidoreductase